MEKQIIVNKDELIELFYEGYCKTHDKFGLTNFIVNKNIEPIVKYLQKKGIKIKGEGREIF